MPDRQQSTPTTRRERRRLERDSNPSGHRRRSAQGAGPRRAPSILVISLIALLAGFGAIAGFQVLGAGGDEPDPSAVGDLLVPPSTIPATVAVAGHSAGSADAPVVIEIYGDYQCPVCARFAREYLGRLIADFVVPGDARVVDRPIAFLGTGQPDESEAAAIGAACAADQDRYWAYHDLLLWNQRGENDGAFSATRLAAMADSISLDRTAWDACIADPGRLDEIRRATSDAAAAGINSTPTIVVNGQRIVGMPRTYEELSAAVSSQLVASGPASGGFATGAHPDP